MASTASKLCRRIATPFLANGIERLQCIHLQRSTSCFRTRPPQHGRENQSRKRWQAVIASKIESSDGSMKRKERQPVECTTDSIDVRKFQIHLSDLFLNCIIFMNSRTYILKCPFLLGATTSPVDESSLRQVGQFFVLFISGLGEG